MRGTHVKRSGRNKTLKIAILIVSALALVLVSIAGYAASVYFKPAPQLSKTVLVDIPSGSSTSAIAEILHTEGLINDPLVFRIKSRLAGADGQLRAGTYEVSEAGDQALIDLLLAGPKIKYVDVTIPEGFTVRQIAERLEAQAGIPSAEFLALADGGAEQFVEMRPYLADAYEGKLEGYLFPKTYRIVEGTDARGAIDIMLDQFEEEFSQVDLSKSRAAGLTEQQVVVLASMIERETMVDDERPLVSSVIYNRIERGMLLQIDATIEYVIESKQLRLTYADLKLESPYNTYKYKGLPPGPISSPGLASLQAAANPDTTDYLFYVLTSKDGRHTFTTNEADHLKAKAISKEVFGQ